MKWKFQKPKNELNMIYFSQQEVLLTFVKILEVSRSKQTGGEEKIGAKVSLTFI